MEPLTLTTELLDNISRPAFIAVGGVVKQVNTAAAGHLFKPGDSICDLISTGAEEYEAFSSGRLSLTLTNASGSYAAVVLVCEAGQLFCLEPDFDQPELAVLALAAQQLREPLSTALTCTNALLPDESLEALANVQMQLARINKSLHSLHRTICNMSDAAQLAKVSLARAEYRNATNVFNAILEKASSYTSQAGRKLRYEGLPEGVSTMLDEEKLERAVMNLLSNAIKFSPDGSEIFAALRHSGKKLYFSICSEVRTQLPQPSSGLFSQFLRAPGLEPAERGVGLGMTVVRGVATAHNGTLLMDMTPEGRIRFTFSIEERPLSAGNLRGKVLRPGDYTGGYDHALVELSDVLPPELYK